MSNDERKELSQKLHYGLALAEQRMLEEKALRNEEVIQGTPDGKIRKIPARKLLCNLRQEEPLKEGNS